MSAPRFSVIVSTHNRRNLIGRTIESVLCQTNPSFELIVIDNGSSDDTPQVVERYQDPRLQLYRTRQPTASCDGPRNWGLELANGELISFLDDDDYWYPERLAEVGRTFDAHPGVEVVCHYENRRVGNRLAGLLRHGPLVEPFYEHLLYERNCLSPCATTVRAEVLRAVGGFTLRPEIDGVADYDLWLRLAARGTRFHFIERPLGEFTENGQNLSVVDVDTSARIAFIVTEHVLRYERACLPWVSTRGAWRLVQIYGIAARAYRQSGRWSQAMPYLLRCAQLLAARPMLAGQLGRHVWRRRLRAFIVGSHSDGC